MSRSGRRAAPGRIETAEWAMLALLLAWLIWIPLPFGSVVELAQVPLIAVPLSICCLAAATRLVAGGPLQTSRPLLIWTSGAVVFALIVALQIAPLGESLVAAISPAAARIWADARALYSLSMDSAPRDFPRAFTLSIAPNTTRLQLFRFLACLAAMLSSAILIRTHRRRAALAIALCASAALQVLYGVREATLRRYEIWGWKNTLIFNRVTGTFVNPNHFAHYLALILPVAVFLIAAAWYQANRTSRPRLAEGIARLAERQLPLAVLGVFTALTCLCGILVAQSRGALLATLVGGGVAGAGLLGSGRRRGRWAGLLVRFAAGAVLGGLLLYGLVSFLGQERTVERFRPNEVEQETAVGRLIGIKTALAIWDAFPIFGSGLGTFDEVALTYQTADLTRIYNHAHCDYAEILATTGIGFLVAFVTIAAGYVWLWRATFTTPPQSRRTRAFLVAAIASITIALVHALFDFNFFIPANPATLAVIAGSAVAMKE
jgi:O-Antigen ligase